MPKLCCICEYYTQNPANVSTTDLYIYKYLDTGLLFSSLAIFDPVKLTSSAFTHAHACAPAKLVVSGGLAPPAHRPWAGGPSLSATSGSLVIE